MKRRGVHSAYAISLLVIIAVGMSGIVYNYMNTSNSILSSNAEYTINTATLSGIQSGTLTWYDIVLYNTGNKPFIQTKISVDINGVTYNLSQNTTTIGPSQTLEQKGILNAAVVYGNSYTVRVSAITSDGSTFVTSRQINAG
ncbi:MAG: hypothetical protein KGI02_10110 [Thaumarchaeota archaeon]|nr:hypothetical protein [Nitrososphaerota archaeon]MDE1832702.1 hypothetical protein [Nitrososphaerota archaeon]MDE1878838.1 hypothetical protein [Nitrososphaerota archaeon]